MAHGTLKTYSTSRWSVNGTRTSRLAAMLMRSLRSSRKFSQRLMLRYDSSRIRASSADSPSRRGTSASASAYRLATYSSRPSRSQRPISFMVSRPPSRRQASYQGKVSPSTASLSKNQL